MSGPPFTMSKYVNETELLRDKCAWLEGQLAEQKVSLSDSQSAEAEYEVILIDEDGSEEWASGTAGPREEALAGARHYAIQHAKDGPVKIVEVTRRVIERLSPLPEAPK